MLAFHSFPSHFIHPRFFHGNPVRGTGGKLMNCECIPSAWRHPDGPSSLLSFALIIAGPANKTKWCWCFLVYLCTSHKTIGPHLDLSWKHYTLQALSAALDIDCKRISIWYTWFYFWCGIIYKYCKAFTILYTSRLLAKRHRIWCRGIQPWWVSRWWSVSTSACDPLKSKISRPQGEADKRATNGTSLGLRGKILQSLELRSCVVSVSVSTMLHSSFKVCDSCPSTSRLWIFFTFGSSPGANTFVC